MLCLNNLPHLTSETIPLIILGHALSPLLWSPLLCWLAASISKLSKDHTISVETWQALLLKHKAEGQRSSTQSWLQALLKIWTPSAIRTDSKMSHSASDSSMWVDTTKYLLLLIVGQEARQDMLLLMKASEHFKILNLPSCLILGFTELMAQNWNSLESNLSSCVQMPFLNCGSIHVFYLKFKVIFKDLNDYLGIISCDSNRLPLD